MTGQARNGYLDTLTYKLCPGDTLRLQTDKTVEITRDTIVLDTITVADPTADSVHVYVVNVYPTFRLVERKEIVLGQSFYWCGETIREPGTYTKVYKSQNGCDSTRVLVVTQREGLEMELRKQQVIPFCDSVAWNGQIYTESTVIIDTLRSVVYGCDSIVTTILTKGIPFYHYETIYLYAGETLTWHGQEITTAGTYYDQYTNLFGCDSTYEANVILRSAAQEHLTQTTRQQICEGDVFRWRGENHTLSGTYYDTVFVGGTTQIDTLYVLYLTVNPTYEQDERISRSTFPFLYRGQLIPAPGTYPIHYNTVTGCDSTINVIVNRQVIIHEETATICEGDEYVWRLKHLKEAQTYTETIKGKDGTDSVTYVLHLNVHRIPETRITRTICKGDSYVFGTQILTEAGEYRHTFKQDGCDSTVILSLNLADVDTIIQVHRLNPGDTYTWPANGHTYSEAGTYQVTNINRFGCDSITRLVLTINHVDTIDSVATICPGETLYWHSISASQTGHYENVETGAHGDMRYYRLDLTVRELKEVEVNFQICGDWVVSFNGKVYTKAGHYYDKGTCDTLYHIIVSQTPSLIYQTDARLDGVNPYTWTYWSNGTEHTDNFSTPGTYEFSSLNATTGCNDIWRLVLSLDQNSYHFVEKVTLCEGETFSWRGHDDLSLIPGEAVYTEHLYTRTGLDSIYELQVTVLPVARSFRTINFCGSTEWKGTTYSTSTIVYDTLTAANGCDSIVEISLRKNEGFFRRDTATIVQGEKLIWHGQTITTDGIYEDRQVTSLGCDSIYELHVGIKPATPQTNMITEIAEICEGDYYEWRGHNYYNKGLYPDTVYAQTPDERDTIYVLNLNVIEQERRREQYFFCENEKLERIYGEDYNALIKTDSVYRDTVEVPNLTRMGCPDIVYLEIYKYPVKRHTETQILHPGDTIHWNEQQITRGGDYTKITKNVGDGGCDSVSVLHVVEDLREEVYVCRIDTPDLYPYIWREDTFYTSGIWYDTVYTTDGDIREFYSLDLTITQPYDTTIYLHNCKNRGVVWRDELYLQDTTFIARIPATPYNPKNPCDSVFHVHIKMDTLYDIRIDTTLCEYQLPLIIGRVNPDTIWWEGNFRHESDTTACGCDSTIEGHLTIIPSLERSDSTFICSDEIKEHPVVLGNLTHPAFLDNDGGKWAGKWEGKWRGVAYSQDTIVWDCDHRYFHHIFVRPSQRVVPERVFYLCPGDTIPIFWPQDTTRFYSNTTYYERKPMTNTWTDQVHGNTFYDDSLTCDSVTRWTIRVLPVRDTESTQHILLGDSLLWAGIWRYHTGDYDSIMQAKDTNSLGDTCTYVHTLHLIVDTAYMMRDTVELCELAGKTINHRWADTHLTQFNTPDRDSTFHVIHTLRSHSTLGLDSIYDLYVDFHLISRTVLYDTICSGDSLAFNRHWYEINNNQTRIQYLTESGDYRDTITALNGCDSIITLHLYVRDRIPTRYRRVDISDKQAPYEWRHRWTDENGQPIDSVRYLTASGTYICRMLSIHGCDSIDSLALYIHPTYYIEDDTIDICQNETPYTWRGKDNITTTGDYVYSALTVDGYDSTHVVHINVWPQQYTTVYYENCQGDSIQLNGKTYKQPGVYVDTLHTIHGCDSVVTIHYNWHDTYLIEKIAQTDDKTPYVWTEGGITKVLTHSGTYYDTLQTVNGCDSVIALRLTVYTTYEFFENVTVCESELPYNWHGRVLWTDGTYYDSLQTQQNYDSVYVLTFSTNPIYTTDLYYESCHGDSIQFNGKTYKQPGVYRDTLLTREGCDSVMVIHYDWHDTYLIEKTAQTDDKTPYVWTEGGITKVLTHSGIYYDTLQTVNGCDSVIALSLTVHTTYEFFENATVCQSELPYSWHGRVLWTDGTYYDSLQTSHHYDSVYVLTFSINPSYSTDLYYETCQDGSIQFNGKTYTQPGIYQDTLLTREGCDSVMIIHYDWHDTYFIQKTAETDDKTPYVWTEGGITRVLTHSGIYYDTLQTIHGCDSVIALRLSVYPTYLFEENQIICESETPYLWRGHQYWTSGTYMDSLQTQQHYDSIYALHLTVRDTFYVDHHFTLCQGESFTYNGKTYNRGGVYLDTLATQHGCDSIVILRVQELPHYFFSDTVAVANRQPYVWRGKNLTHTGIYGDTLTASTGCDSIYQLVLTIYDKEVLRDTVIRACENDLPIRWRGKWLTQTGILYDTITTHDVDTIWRVDVHIVPMEYETIEKTLCQGDSYTWNGRVFTTDTLLHDTLYTGMGCGKEYTIFLRFRQTQVVEMDAKTSSDRPYVWNIEGTSYTYRYTGTYEHVVRTADDTCDSIRYVLRLVVGPVYDFRDSIRLCESDLPLIWHNQMIYETGTYYDSLQTVMGYDSVYTMKVLQIMPSYYGEQNIDLCAGSSAFYYRGKPYSTPGVFYDTIPSISGCDSVFRITVRVQPTYEIYDTVHISDKETYTFDGRILDVPGPYVAYKKTAAGCDSILHLQLYVHPSYLFSSEEEICDNETFTWRGHQLKEEGYYYDSLLTTQGYDSVYKLHLIVHRTYFFQEAVEVCPNRTTYLHGIDISQPGIYMDTLYTIHGCDSVYKITVNWTRSFRQEFGDTICQGESYNFFGVNYTRSGTYKYEIGCDSVIILHLLVRPKDIIEKRVVIADEDLPYRYLGREYWHTDIYVDSLTNRYGCDSLFKLNLIVSEHVSPWYQIPLCPGSEIKIDSMVITKSGLYTFLRRSKVSGLLDSLYRVEIYDAPAYDLPLESRRMCMGDTLYYGGQALTRGGHYDFRLKTVDGCDSLMHLDLTVYPTYQYYTDATITDYQTYLWRGREYDKQGEYNQTFPTINDCDSTYTLRLTVIPTQRYYMEDTICLGDKYIWRGDTLRDQGFYSDTVCVLGTHTSAIYSLHLLVVTPTRLERAMIGEICADDKMLEIQYEYTGAEPVLYSILFDQLAKDQGFRDVVNIPFTGDMVARADIPQRSEVQYLEHTDYIRPDYYTLRLVFDNGVCPASQMDSVSFLVRYPSWIIEQNWDDVVAPLRPELNGHYVFAQYDWYVNGSRQQNNGLGYLHSDNLQVGDEVVLYATREGDSYAIPTCPLVIQPKPADTNPHPILVYPTQAPRYMPIVNLQSDVEGTYSIYSSTGILIETGIFRPGEQQLTLPAVNGLWLIRTQTENGQGETHKVVVY